MTRHVSWAALLVAVFLVGHAPAETPDAEELEARLEALQEEIDAIGHRIAADREERDEEMEVLAGIERTLGRLGRTLRETREVVQENQSELDTLRGEEEGLESALADEEGELAEQIRAAHRMGNRSRLRLILSQDDPQRFSRTLAYHSYLTRARVATIDRVSGKLAELAQVRRSIQERLDTLTELEASQARDLAEQEAAREERAAAVAAIDARITDRESRLAELEQNAMELQRLIEELATALADIPPEMEAPAFADLRGQLDMPVSGRVAAGFGDRRSGEMNWNGWLIRASQGTDVQAIAHGRVAFSDWLRGYGLVLIVDHGDGFLSLYAHNDSLLFDVGDWVRPGQVIATVGNSGGEETAGLYFELRKDGRPVDPSGWLQR